MGDGAESLDGLGAGSNVLLLGPSVSGELDDGCRRLLDGDDEERAVLVVSFALPPGQWVRRWDDHVGERPDRLVVVTTSDTFGGPTVDEDLDGVEVEYLSSPGDLTGLGMIISKYLERWYESDLRMALCFDSLTAILQYEELENVYRFLHLMTTRLSGAGAHAHFHFDPATQDEQAVSTLASTFDAMARYDDDQGWDVTRR